MPEEENKIRCPTCAHEFTVGKGADRSHLSCPHCEVDIPESALRAASEVAEELAPGFRPGQRIGNYIIESLLGTGGMAVVFRGRQLSLNRHVAIKILPEQLAKTKLFIERFESEAAVLANLNHPNIVGVIDRGREADTYFIVMEYVEGETLKDQLFQKTRLPPEEILLIADQALAGLEYAHRRGVVHRDIKPGNIMINREGMVKIADFGLAHLAKARGGLDVTRETQTMGTLKYMAPEQLSSAKDVDCRADLYSFGVCIYEMLTGKLPLGMFKMPSECDGALDARWDDVILRALKMDPEERFATAEEMAGALRDIATTPRVTLREQEEQEEPVVGASVTVSLTACAGCGHESAPTAHICERCGAPLDDLFDQCPSCQAENRVDVAQCAECGADLESHRAKQRRRAETIQTQARNLVSERRYDPALAQLKKLWSFRTREYAPVRESAGLWIEKIKQRRDRFLQRTYEAGQRMFAEGRAERALQIWEPLPDGYRDVAARRKEIAARLEGAKAALADASRVYKAGDLAGAIAAWEQAGNFWPHDNELRKRLAAARIQLGNLNLKRGYLKESEEAAAKGNIADALALCRKVLDLNPSDSSALALLRNLEEKEREFRELQARSGPRVILRPARPEEEARRRLKPTTIGAVVGAISVLLLAVLIFVVVLPASRHSQEGQAAQMLREILSLKEQGRIDAAQTLCSRIRSEYPNTPAAQKASEIEQEMQTLNAGAHERCNEADALASKGDLESVAAGFRKFEKILAGPPVTAVETYYNYAKKRLEELRERIALVQAEKAAAHEKRGQWFEALQDYRTAADEFGVKGEPVASRLVVARRRVEEHAAQLAAGREAAGAGKWDEAYRAAVAALDLVPADPKGHEFLAAIAPKLTPPPGMVLVPPGEYTAGGSDDSPKRAVSVAHGFFVDRAEVTFARFGEFLRASGRAPPPGWSEDGLPPAGAEKLPVVGVTWEEAAAFAAWAGGALPTEEQWECASRGKSGQLYPWGDKWDPLAGVFGFGPATAGAMEKDRSPFGCVDMASNVAEWTSTKVAGPSTATEQPAAPRRAPGRAVEQLPRYVVKGSSWAGIEPERPTVVVLYGSAGLAPAGSPALLTPQLETPESPVRCLSNIEMHYEGVWGAGEATAWVRVRRWMPTWDQWAEDRCSVASGGAIGGQKAIAIEEGGSKPKRRTVQVDLSTGCVLLRCEDKGWLEYRDPAGVTRRLPYEKLGLPPVIKVNEYREPPPAPGISLEKTAMAAARMIGRADRRYVNVGFRCIKALWTPPPPEKEREKKVEKPAQP